MLETTKYARKKFLVDAVRVTQDNMQDIVYWTKGEIRSNEKGQQYIKLNLKQTNNPRHTQAFVGDWVVSVAGGGFKVYTKKAFVNSFEQESVETTILDVHPEEREPDIRVMQEVGLVEAAPTTSATPVFVEPEL